MSSNQENIEARLAAYVDGELTAGEREEIERHLTANPQHRRLIDDLMQTKVLLGELPRVKAPLDVLESLQSQLERGALLGAPEDLSGAETYRIGFWSQFRAIAAVLVLTSGLAAVVYFVLPRDRAVPELAIAPLPDRAPAGVAVEEGGRSAVDELAKPSGEKHLGTDVTAESHAVAGKGGIIADAKAKDSGFMEGGVHNAFALNAPAVAPAGADPFGPGVRSELAASGVGDNAAYIVVDTDNATLTNSRVADYLAYNRTTWEQLPAPPALQGQYAMARMQNQAVQTTLVPGAPHRDGENLKAASNDTIANADVARHAKADQPPANVADQSQSAAAAQRRELQPSQTQQRVDEQQIGSQIAGGFAPTDNRDIDLSPQAIQSRQHINTGSLIVARNLNMKQVQELNDTLSSGRQRAQLVPAQAGFSQQPFFSAGRLPATDKPADIAPGDKAGLTLALPGTQVELKWMDAVLGERNELFSVDAQGKIHPPVFGEVDVSNLTLDEINVALGRLAVYKKELSIDPPTATRIVASGATTQPEAAQLPVAQIPATQPQDQLVDVVIIVRENLPPATQPLDPSTQPAEPAMEQHALPSTQPQEPVQQNITPQVVPQEIAPADVAPTTQPQMDP